MQTARRSLNLGVGECGEMHSPEKELTARFTEPYRLPAVYGSRERNTKQGYATRFFLFTRYSPSERMNCRYVSLHTALRFCN